MVGPRAGRVPRSRLLVGSGLALAVLARLPVLSRPITEHHEFRQTQTAYQALLFHERGIDLFHPLLPIFGRGSSAPFELPLYQALASIPMSWGLAPDPSLRLTAIATFALSALLLYLFVRRLASQHAALLTFVAFVASPFSLLWGRTSMIEYLATAGTLGWAWGWLAWRQDRKWWFAVVGMIGGVVGLTVKVTTALPWAVMLATLALAIGAGVGSWRERFKALVDPGLVAMSVVPLAAAAIWTRHADAIKASNPATRFITSDELGAWNFGTMEQRSDPQNWITIAQRVGPIVGFIGLGVILAGLWIRRREPMVWALVATVVLPVAVFFNLYAVHDYYLVAVTPALAALLGLSAEALWASLPARSGPIGVAALLMWIVPLNLDNAEGWRITFQRNPNPTPAVSASNAIRHWTEPGDLVVVQGQDWNSSALYYARREGYMIRPSDLTDDTVERLRRDAYRLWFVQDPNNDDISRLVAWPWIEVLDSQNFRLGRGAVPASRDHVVVGAASPPRKGQRLESCVGAGVAVPVGSAGVELAVRWTRPEERTRLVIDGVSVPPGRWIRISGAAAGGDGTVTVVCPAGAELSRLG